MINIYCTYDGIQTLTGHFQRGLTEGGILTMSGVGSIFWPVDLKRRKREGEESSSSVQYSSLLLDKKHSDQLPFGISVILGGYYTCNQISHHKIKCTLS